MRNEDGAGPDSLPGIDRPGFLKCVGATAGALTLPRLSLTDEQVQDAYGALSRQPGTASLALST